MVLQRQGQSLLFLVLWHQINLFPFEILFYQFVSLVPTRTLLRHQSGFLLFAFNFLISYLLNLLHFYGFPFFVLSFKLLFIFGGFSRGILKVGLHNLKTLMVRLGLIIIFIILSLWRLYFSQLGADMLSNGVFGLSVPGNELSCPHLHFDALLIVDLAIISESANPDPFCQIVLVVSDSDPRDLSAALNNQLGLQVKVRGRPTRASGHQIAKLESAGDG